MTLPPDGVGFTAIVPTLDEDGEIIETLVRARRALGSDAELIVVDGGSRDETIRRARGMARVIAAGGGRGAQLAAGLAAAEGEIIVLLHADAWLDPEAGPAIRRAVADGRRAGCLRLRFRPPAGARLAVLAVGIALRTRLFHTATGDQAIFATRDVLAAIGGIPPLPLFEDVLLVRALRRHAGFRPLDASVTASGRRWRERGFVRTVATHAALRLAFAIGADPRTLDRVYRRARAG